jgi:hypothetical protein
LPNNDAVKNHLLQIWSVNEILEQEHFEDNYSTLMIKLNIACGIDK